MSVDKKCSPDKRVFTLNITVGERIRHTLNSSGSVTWVLAQDGTALLQGSGQHTATLEWPAAPLPPTGTAPKHSLAMQCVGKGQLVWQIERLTANGAVMETIKKCDYDNPDGNDDHYDNIKIKLT